MRSPSGDSDKENWVPGENGSDSRRRLLPFGKINESFQPKVVPGDKYTMPLQAINIGGDKNKRRRGAYIVPTVFEDLGNDYEVGEEMQKFMRGEVSPSKKGDLDCIQGLLSLSQGNWR